MSRKRTHIMTDLIPISKQPTRREVLTSSGSPVCGRRAHPERSNRGLEQPISRMRIPSDREVSNNTYKMADWSAWGNYTN